MILYMPYLNKTIKYYKYEHICIVWIENPLALTEFTECLTQLY